MKQKRLFALLAAVCSLAVSCQKESVSISGSEQLNVPEGMKYVSIELGVPVSDGDETRISGFPTKWNSGSESVAVIGKKENETVIYEFKTEKTTAVKSTTTISGTIDVDAVLYCVVFPYKNNYEITVEDGSLKSISIPKIGGYTYTNTGVSSGTPYACKINCSEGGFSAASALQPLFSLLKVTTSPITEDIIPDYVGVDKKAPKPTSYMDCLYLTGIGISGEAVVDFSGDTAVTTIVPGAVEESTVKVELKTNTTSGYPTAGDYYIPIVPGTIGTLSIKATSVNAAEYDNLCFADYTVDYGENVFKQGAFKSVNLIFPFIYSVETVSAVLDGTSLLMKGSALVTTGGKLKDTYYTYGFKYREKDSGNEWTEVPASCVDGTFEADVTIVAGKTYEVKAYAVAPLAVKVSDAPEDLLVEGEVIESSGYIPPIIVTVNKFSSTQYDGTDSGGYWKYVGDDDTFIFPAKKQIRYKLTDVYDYYATKTDASPSVRGIKICSSVANGYYFGNGLILQYGGWFEFPGIEGYKVTEVKISLYASTLNKDLVATTTNAAVSFDQSVFSSCKGGTLIGKATYDASEAKEKKVLTLKGAAGDLNDGVKIWFGTTAYFFEGFEITYSK